MTTRILVIDDDDGIRGNVIEMLEMEGFEAIGATDGEEGVALAVQRAPDLVICDVTMPGKDGFEVFEILSAKPETAVIPFIFLSARARRADIRKGMTLGASDYLTKPFTRVELLDSIRARLRRRSAESPNPEHDGATPARAGSELGDVVVADPAMRELFATVDRFARGSISVLILGETGVGKEVLAERIHQRSGREGPFTALNCAALSESLIEAELFGHEKGAFTGASATKPGLFESADGGTLFLDEVGDLPAPTQVKLLRVLETRRVRRVGGRDDRAIDVRFVSATNRDVDGEVAAGRFRQDLLFRLNSFTLTVPPLRDRRADVLPLAERFVSVACRATARVREPRLSAEASRVLEGYRWPGNIRELRNVIERAVVLCDGEVLLPEHLPPNLASASVTVATDSAPGEDARARLLRELEETERRRVVEALAQCGGNQTKAAERLGISRRTLVTRLGEYDLPRPRKRE